MVSRRRGRRDRRRVRPPLGARRDPRVPRARPLFFFQAEDGIRDFHVTGVQTCALPISDLADRITRGDVRHVVTEAGFAARFDGLGGRWTAIAVGPGPEHGATPDGWLPYADSADAPTTFTADGLTRASDPLLLYFTSGTTAQPKLVEHTHASYPA